VAFTWEPLKIVTVSSYSELKDAVNTLTDAKLAPRFNWLSSIPVKGTLIKASIYTEVQDAVDYADDKNVCLSDKAAHHVTYNTSEFSSNDGNEDTTQDVSNFDTDHVTHDASYNATLHNTVDAADDGSHNATQDVGYDATLYTNVHNDRHATYNTARDIGYDGALYTQVDSSQNASIYGTADSNYKSGMDISYYHTKYGTVRNSNYHSDDQDNYGNAN